MIKRIKAYLAQRYQRQMHKDYWFITNQLCEAKHHANKSFLENQKLSGRIKLLEEQHDIMHNFLVEINKYLVNLTEKGNGLRVNETKAKGQKANEGRGHFRQANKKKRDASG
jgi:hypothetical protein